MRELIEKFERLGSLTLGDVIGASGGHNIGGVDRVAFAREPKFKAAMVKLTGKRKPQYRDILNALMKLGLDRHTADQYAIASTDKFASSWDRV